MTENVPETVVTFPARSAALAVKDDVPTTPVPVTVIEHGPSRPDPPWSVAEHVATGTPPSVNTPPFVTPPTVTVGGVASMLTPVTEASALLPARSVATPEADWFAPFDVSTTSEGQLTSNGANQSAS